MSTLKWDEAVVVVTGGGSGIGRSIAISTARRGARVVVSDIEEEYAAKVAEEIRDSGGTAIAVQTDVGDYQSVVALADRAYQEYGRVDVLCNNAGVTMRPFRAIWDASLADFEWMMRINYFGVIHGLLAFLPRMRAQQGHKHIVNTSSFATLDEVPGHGMYTASKAAIDGISDVLRAELADHGDDFGVTILYPGAVKTRIATSERLRAEADRSEVRQVKAYPYPWEPKPHNQPIEPDSVGEMVVHAIEHNLPYCLTHPAPVEGLKARVDNWTRGYVPASPSS